MSTQRSITLLTAFVTTIGLAGFQSASAVDWPQWRYDANRSAASPQELPETLHLQWVRQYPALEPAWEDPVNRDRMPFDRAYEPVVMGTTLFVGSNRNDRLTALDTRTGKEKWRFYADGPIRFAPVAWKNKLFFVSDDGYLYCLDAATGKILWKQRGGPDARKALGNSRLVSAWPARGGPVLIDDTIYFAASIWPFMGIFIYAIDAETGRIVWTNDGIGSNYMQQPHGGAISFSTVAPQGALVAAGDKLLVPGGRSAPASFDRRTGELLYYHLNGSPFYQIEEIHSHKGEGGSQVCAFGNFYFNHRDAVTGLFDLETGHFYTNWGKNTYPVMTPDEFYLSGQPIIAHRWKDLHKKSREVETINKKTREKEKKTTFFWELPERWSCAVDGSGALIKAGGRLYAGGANRITALTLKEDAAPQVTWQADIDGHVAQLVTADDRLFAVTLDGKIYAFGAEAAPPMKHAQALLKKPLPSPVERQAQEYLRHTAINPGYILVYGVGNGDLLEALARCSEFSIVGVDPDEEKISRLRQQLDAADLYGTRVSLHVGRPSTFMAPAYFAALVVGYDTTMFSDKLEIQTVYQSLRPYGGTAFLKLDDAARQQDVIASITALDLEGATVENTEGHIVLRRPGPLPNSSAWTHQYGDIANTNKSDERRVRSPLGLVWFGGSDNEDVLPRHAHGPPPQIVGGRLFIQGVNMLSARDVYTGAVLWKREFTDLGTFGQYYDESYVPRGEGQDPTYDQSHIPGANIRGTNYVVTPEAVYLVNKTECLLLNPATGETLKTFTLPADKEADTPPPEWTYIGVYQDILIAGMSFAKFTEQVGDKPNYPDARDLDISSSKVIVALDRHTGRVLWTRSARHAFRHNTIVVGADRLFCIDNLPKPVMDLLRRRGRSPESRPALLCLDVRSGEPRWIDEKNVFGTWLSYSTAHDVLLQCGRHSDDMVGDEAKERMMGLRGRDGHVLWDHPTEHSGPVMIHGDTIYTSAWNAPWYHEGIALNLLTGDPVTRRHPLTDEILPWRYHRLKGCNYVTACEYLLTFRSGTASFYDLTNNGGTGSIGGFKSGCTSNMVAADGLLNIPEYTRTCVCSYPNQTSLALIHMPDMEQWASNDVLPAPEQRIVRLGLNFGAPGDRMADDGTLWLDMPSVGGGSPNPRVVMLPDQEGKDQEKFYNGRQFRMHSSRVREGNLKWVAASGLIGVTEIRVTMAPQGHEARDYTVRLHFMEPEDLQAGRRVFDVTLQNHEVLKNFDIVNEAGGSLREVVREYRAVRIADQLIVSFRPRSGEAVLCGLQAFVE